jgi:hypothetical protein
MPRNDLQNALLDRAEGELPLDDDSSWAKFDYLKLRQTLEAIVLCMELSPMESQPEATPRLVISNESNRKLAQFLRASGAHTRWSGVSQLVDWVAHIALPTLASAVHECQPLTPRCQPLVSATIGSPKARVLISFFLPT